RLACDRPKRGWEQSPARAFAEHLGEQYPPVAARTECRWVRIWHRAEQFHAETALKPRFDLNALRRISTPSSRCLRAAARICSYSRSRQERDRDSSRRGFYGVASSAFTNKIGKRPANSDHSRRFLCDRSLPNFAKQ